MIVGRVIADSTYQRAALLLGLDIVTAISLLVWLGAAFSTPLLERLWGWPGLRAGLIATVVLQGAAALISQSEVWSPGRLIVVGAGVVGGGYIAEFVGIRTGLPFGSYFYTGRLEPRMGGIPILVAIAYLGVLTPAWGVADLLVGESRGVAFVLASALAATAWDLLLDPLLVSWRVWEWRNGGGYFGIPWQNFLCWFLVTAALTVVLQPGPLATAPLILLYSAAWFKAVVAMLGIWRLHGPALVGGLVMGVFVLAAWLRFSS